MRVHVHGGTGAGSRPPFNGRPHPWQCNCFTASIRIEAGSKMNTTVAKPKWNPGFLAACPDCKMRRPS